MDVIFFPFLSIYKYIYLKTFLVVVNFGTFEIAKRIDVFLCFEYGHNYQMNSSRTHQSQTHPATMSTDKSKPKRKQPTKQTSKQSTPQLTSTKYPWLPFPRKTDTFNELSEEVFCVCRKPDTGALMVGCDGCDDWFHFSCVKVDSKYSKLISSYYCPYCDLEGKGTTLWKRKCRLTTCFKPVGEESKYCSKEHGMEFMKSLVEKLDGDNASFGALDKDTWSQLINNTQNLQTLKTIGDVLPTPDTDFTQETRIRRFNESIDSLNESKQAQVQKKKLLIRAKENIKILNDQLSQGKKKKLTVCGFEPLLNSDNATEESLQSNETTKLKSLFEEQQTITAPEDDESESEGTIKPSLSTEICLLEKRKCPRHANWQNIIGDEIELELYKLDEEVALINTQIERLLKTLTVDHFEAQSV